MPLSEVMGTISARNLLHPAVRKPSAMFVLKLLGLLLALAATVLAQVRHKLSRS